MQALLRKKLVFDFAGVLFRWHPETMLMREVPHLAPDETSASRLKAEVFQAWGGDWGEFDRGTVEVPALIERICRRTGRAPRDVQRIVERIPLELQPMTETVRWLQRLRSEQHALYFLSNMPEPYAAHLEREHTFVTWFADGVFSARVHHIKPERGIFELAQTRFGAAQPAELVFIDDHLPNVEAARSLGWNAVHFTGAAAAEAELAANGWLA
ncbi:MAG: HAD-IA family hydrolase [Rubrivivax sp.]|nr:HAD-IA family hydrolase [Rubrivivax sp.]